MSIEIEPLNLEYNGNAYHVFTSVCEEHRDQVDFIRVVRIPSGLQVSLFKPKQARSELEKIASAMALSAVNELDWDSEESVIDYFDHATGESG